MAVLTAGELAQIRRDCAALGLTVNYIKPQINAAAQAVEDWYETNKGGISTAIDIATAPFVFTASQKKAVGAYWMLYKFGKEK